MRVFLIGLIVAYVIVNLITAKRFNAWEMKTNYIEGQCLVGKVCANIFYAPAWALKGIRYIVLAAVK